MASTCTRISGFTDEISCSFDEDNSNYLIVTGGFDSKTFVDTDFSFSIAEIQNPSTDKRTDGFVMEIYDKLGGLMYQTPDDDSVTFMLSPSDFAYAYVESKSPVNGVSSLYIVTLTLGVETSQSAKLEFNPPDEVEF